MSEKKEGWKEEGREEREEGERKGQKEGERKEFSLHMIRVTGKWPERKKQLVLLGLERDSEGAAKQASIHLKSTHWCIYSFSQNKREYLIRIPGQGINNTWILIKGIMSH